MTKEYKLCTCCRLRRKEVDIINEHGMCINCLMMRGRATEEMIDILNKRAKN